MGLIIVPYWHASDRNFMKAYLAAMRARQFDGPSAVEFGLSLPLTTWLIWFTYFSKSKSNLGSRQVCSISDVVWRGSRRSHITCSVLHSWIVGQRFLRAELKAGDGQAE